MGPKGKRRIFAGGGVGKRDGRCVEKVTAGARIVGAVFGRYTNTMRLG